MKTQTPLSTVTAASALRFMRSWAGRLVLGTALLFTAAALMQPRLGHAQPAPTLQLPDFTELVERVGPSVVNIRTLEKRSNAGGSGGLDMEPNIEELFRRFGIPMPNRPDSQRPDGQRPDPRRGAPRGNNNDEEPQQRGLGSGFVLTSDGYIMTNAHVVEGADEVIVTLTDKRELKAKIIGADKRSDVAVVKVEATGLPVVKIGDVNRLKVGEWVMAIGSPFGLDNTVTAGIVSAKQRDTGAGDLIPLIQTDVAINPGNSGGPLINLRGEVVGINSQIYSRSGGFMGISFAIPIDEAVRVSDQLRATGRVARGRIGVQIGPVTKEVAEAIGLGQARGASVVSVEKDGPADKAGVEAGDIIIKVDGKTVEKSADLPRMIGAVKPGAKTTIQVFRRGSTKELSLATVEYETERSTRRASAAEPGSAPAASKSALGITVSDLPDAQRKELRIKGGVRVDAVEGPGARAGVREGDVIQAVDNVDIADSKQFAAAAAKLDKAKPVSLLVRRGDATNYLVIRGGR
jgi:serine protease Do